MKGINRVTGGDTTWQVGGKTYYIAATVNSPAAWAEVCEHIKTRRDSPLDLLAAKIDQFSEPQQAVLLNAALDQEARRNEDPTSEELDHFLNTLDGAAFLLWIGLRARHPEFKQPADVMGLIEGRLQEAQQKIDQAGGFSDLGKSSSHAEPEATAAPANGTLGPESTNS